MRSSVLYVNPGSGWACMLVSSISFVCVSFLRRYKGHHTLVAKNHAQDQSLSNEQGTARLLDHSLPSGRRSIPSVYHCSYSGYQVWWLLSAYFGGVEIVELGDLRCHYYSLSYLNYLNHVLD